VTWHRGNLRPHEEKICTVCGEPFGPKPENGGRFRWRVFDDARTCSRGCGAKLTAKSRRREYEEKLCPNCGEMFGPRRRRGGLGYQWEAFDKKYSCSNACARTELIDVMGVQMSCQDLAGALGLSSWAVRYRVREGLNIITGKRKP
jgi:hypothetical protein